MRRLLPLVLLVVGAIALPADASKTRLRLERIDSSDFSSDGVVRIYASIVEMEGTIVDDRPAPAFQLKINGKSQGAPVKLQRFQLSGDPLDLVLIVESSALYGPKPPPAQPAPGAPSAPPPPPPKAKKGGKGASATKGGPKGATRKSSFKISAADTGDEPLDRVKEAVQQLLEAMPPKWRVFVIEYGGDVAPHRPFRPASQVGSTIDGLEADGDAGDLKLISAVDAALIEIKKERDSAVQKSEKPSRCLIVLVSDGLNFNMDKNAFRTIGKAAAKALVPIHTIAFSPSDDRGPLLNLGEISKLSNGTFRWAKNADDLRNQIDTLADELNKQYVLTFKVEDSSVENKTFQLFSGDLTSNILKFGGGFSFGGSGKRGLGWWWLAIIAGVLGLGALVLVIISRSQVEYANFGAQKAAPAPARPAAAAQPAARNAIRVGDPAPAAAAPRAAGTARGVVIVVGGGLNGVRCQIAIGGAPILIGKGPATLQITDDPSVSTRHAQISGEPQGITVTDLGSTNGTFVNNQRIARPTLLQDGDLVRFGNTQIKFRAE